MNDVDMSLILNADDIKHVSSLRLWWNNIRHESIETLLLVNDGLTISFSVHMLFTFIELMQLIAFVLPSSDSSVDFGLSSKTKFANSFALVAESSILRFLSRSPEGYAFIAAFTVIIVWLVLIFIVVLYRRRYGAGAIHSTFSVKFLRFYSLMTSSILMLPVLDILWGTISCYNQNMCDVEASVLQQIFIVVFTILFGSLCIAVAAALFEPDPDSCGVLGRTHSRFDVLMQLFKIAVSIVFNVTQRFVLASFAIAPFGVIIAYLFTTLPPYYIRIPLQLRAFALVLMQWTIVCRLSVIGFAVQVQSWRTVLLLLTTFPFVLSACYFIIQVRRAHLAVCPLLLLKNPLDISVKINILLEPVLRSRQLAQMNISRTVIENNQNRLANEADDVIIERMATMYECAIHYFPNSCILRIQAAAFALFFQNNFYCTHHRLSQALILKPKPDETILIEHLRARVMSRLLKNDEARIASHYVNFQKELMNAIDKDRETTLLQLDFWRAFRSDCHNIKRLHILGTKVSRAMASSNTSYDKCLSMHPQSPLCLRMRAGFLNDITNNLESGFQLVQRANSSERNVRKDRLFNSKNMQKNFSSSLFDEENLVVVVSGYPTNLGRITSCNDAAVRAFGYNNQAEMTRLNVSRLVPSPICDYHPEIMRDNLEQGRQAFSGSTRLVFLQHRNGYVFPASMYVTMFCESSQSISFIAVMTKLSVSKHFCFVCDDSFIVRAVSEEAAVMFNVTRADLGSLAIETIVPNFAESIHKFSYQGGIIVPVFTRTNSTQQKFARVVLSSIESPGKGHVYFLRIRFSEGIKSGTKSVRSCRSGKSLRSALTSQQNEDKRTIEMAGGIQLPLNEDNNDYDGGVNDDKDNHGKHKAKSTRMSSKIDGVGSKASSASGQSSKNGSVISVIQRQRVLSSTSTGRTKSIRKFQLLFTLTLMVILSVAVATFIATNIMFDEFRYDVQLVTETARRRFDVVSIAYSLHVLTLEPLGMVSVDEADSSRQMLVDSANSMMESSQLLYNQRLDMLAPHIRLWNSHELKLNELVLPNTIESRYYTLLDASLMLVSSARSSAIQTEFAAVHNQSNVFFAMNNSVFSILHAMNESTNLVQSRTDGIERWMAVWASSVNSIAVLIMFIEVWMVVRPAIRKIEVNKCAVVEVFAEIPRAFIQQLLCRTAMRKRLHTSLQDNGVFRNKRLLAYFDEKIEENEAFDRRFVEMSANTYTAGEDSIHTSPTAEQMSVSSPAQGVRGSIQTAPNTSNMASSSMSTQSITSHHNDTSHHHTTTMQHSSQSGAPTKTESSVDTRSSRFQIPLMMQVMLSLVLCIVYFFMAYVNGYINIRESMSNKPFECNWATYRQMSVHNVVLLLRLLSTPAATGLAISSSIVLDAIRDVERVHKGLVFGDVSMKLSGANNIYNLQDDILFRNGCYPTDWQECLQYQNKLLQSGLNAGIDEFVRMSESVLFEIDEHCELDQCMGFDSMHNAFNQESLRDLEILESRYLQPTMQYSVEQYLKALDVKMGDQFKEQTLTMLFAFIGTMSLMFVVLYRPMIIELDQQVKETRAILLMVPESILKIIPSLRSLLTHNLADI